MCTGFLDLDSRTECITSSARTSAGHNLPPYRFHTKSPPNPKLAGPFVRRLVGIFHSYLTKFGRYYARWVGCTFSIQITQLPFGLILKWSDGTRLEEVVAMQVARKAGFPVPKVISYGDRPNTPHAQVSILMTRILGCELGQVYETLTDQDKVTIMAEMKSYIEAMRRWKIPWVETRICSIINTAVRSVRIPNRYTSAHKTEKEFNEYLISAAFPRGCESKEAAAEAFDQVKKFHSMQHGIVFSHGDIKHHNIMVDKGHVAGFIDWESAGWYPEYWEFTTALQMCPPDFWWYDFMSRLGADRYQTELGYEWFLRELVYSSCFW